MATSAQLDGERETGTGLEILEDRITRAVALIASLKRERDALRAELADARTGLVEYERRYAGVDLEALTQDGEALRRERDVLQAERQEIARRIEDLVLRFDDLDQSA